jgi:hypothetical protein
VAAEGTYDARLRTDRDWVRFLILDRYEPFRLDDGEIDALVAEWPNKYLAAAQAGEIIIARGTISSKMVGDLRVSYGSVVDPDKNFRIHIETLRKEGNRLLLRQPRVVRVV